MSHLSQNGEPNPEDELSQAIPGPAPAGKERHFSVTVMNPVEEVEDFWQRLSLDAQYASLQLEICPDTKKPHFQGCVGYKNQRSFTSVRKNLLLPGQTSWLTKTRNPVKAFAYCNKEESRAPKTKCYKLGAPPARLNVKGDIKARNALLIQHSIKTCVDEGYIPLEKAPAIQRAKDFYDVCDLPSDHLTAPLSDHFEWHWGKTGTGKTYHIKKTYPGAYTKLRNKWWCWYKGHEVVLIDDLGKEQISGSNLKTWCDHYPFPVEAKHTTLPPIRPNKIFVTSNWSIREIYPDPQDYEPLERRFKVIHYTIPFKPPAEKPIDEDEEFPPLEDGRCTPLSQRSHA